MCEIVKWVVFVLLCACSISDCRKKQIPIPLLLLLGVVVCVSLFVCETPSGSDRIGGALLGLLLFLVSKCTREAIGYGDGFGVVVLGMVEGFSKTIQIVWLAFILSGIYGLWQLIILRKGKTDSIPFFPFLFLAKLGAMIL